MHRYGMVTGLLLGCLPIAAYAATLTVTLTWGDVPDETSYVVYRQENGGAWAQQGTLGANTTSFQQTLASGLGVSYCFRVDAVNAIASTASDPICSTPNVPTKPGSLALTFVYTP